MKIEILNNIHIKLEFVIKMKICKNIVHIHESDGRKIRKPKRTQSINKIHMINTVTHFKTEQSNENEN